MTAEIEITSATVWDDGQVARWALLGNTARRVTAVFGCRQQQIIGHGRAPGDVPAVTDEQVVRHSALARSVGLEFLYLLNGRKPARGFPEGGVTPGGGPPVFFGVPIIAIVGSGKVRKGEHL